MSMYDEFYEVVKTIPKGKVASYGYVAKKAGHPRSARRVGQALHHNPDQSTIACHRVVFKDGSLTSSFAFGGLNMQVALLQSEGVNVIDGKVDMDMYSLDKTQV